MYDDESRMFPRPELIVGQVGHRRLLLDPLLLPYQPRPRRQILGHRGRLGEVGAQHDTGYARFPCTGVSSHLLRKATNSASSVSLKPLVMPSWVSSHCERGTFFSRPAWPRRFSAQLRSFMNCVSIVLNPDGVSRYHFGARMTMASASAISGLVALP